MCLNRYFCHRCARHLGLISPVDPSALEPPTSDYQLKKFIKHSAPTREYDNTNSVFDDPSWETHKDYMVSTAASGCLEIDDRNRKNIIFFAGERTGLRYDKGSFSAVCSGIKLVFSEDSANIHQLPSDFTPESKLCEQCGVCVPFDPRRHE